MPKKSFLERMGLVDRTTKPQDEAGLKDIQQEISKEQAEENVAVEPVSSSPSLSQNEMEDRVGATPALQAKDELELRQKLLGEFNREGDDSFGFVSADVTLEDIIPTGTTMETEFASAAEALKREGQDPEAVEAATAATKAAPGMSSQNETVELASIVEEEKRDIPYHTQIAEELSEGEFKAEENLKMPSSAYKPDPYIGDKLDLIIGAYEKNRLLTIDEIYKNSRMETDTKKTIFMTDVFLQAIPANLPQDVKRETVLNILKISGIDLEVLLSDAYKRIDSLNKVLEETVSTSNDIYQRNENTIRELERRIQDLREVNTARQLFQEDQNTMIQYEVQKIINLVEFVKPKNI